ncbi:unnamed protein product, partial [marine sediment metagenome]
IRRFSAQTPRLFDEGEGEIDQRWGNRTEFGEKSRI